MRKNVFGRKFNRDTNERKALFKSLISSLVLNDCIKTTEPKAKAIKADIDKVITIVKKNGTEAAQRGRVRLLDKRGLSLEVQNKLINDIAPRFKNRNGGYTRIIRIGRRFGDNAMEVVMEFTEKGNVLTSRAEGAAKKVKNQKTKVKTTVQKGKVKTKTETSKKNK